MIGYCENDFYTRIDNYEKEVTKVADRSEKDFTRRVGSYEEDFTR